MFQSAPARFCLHVLLLVSILLQPVQAATAAWVPPSVRSASLPSTSLTAPATVTSIIPPVSPAPSPLPSVGDWLAPDPWRDLDAPFPALDQEFAPSNDLTLSPATGAPLPVLSVSYSDDLPPFPVIATPKPYIPAPAPRFLPTPSPVIPPDAFFLTWHSPTPWQALPSAWRAPNPINAFQTWFDPEGMRIARQEADTLQWWTSLHLVRLGYGAAAQPVLEAEQVVAENRIEYHRGLPNQLPQVVEWYLNTAQGMEQGFTLYTRPPVGPQAEPLQLELSLDGTLTADYDEASGTLQLSTPTDGVVLRYDQMRAWDSDGQPLTTTLEPMYTGDTITGLRLLVADTAARYPITIDPLLSSPSWSEVGAQAAAGFGYAVSAAGDVNGDGYTDVLVGAPGYDTNKTDVGAAFLYLGSATGLATTAAWSDYGTSGSAAFGTSVRGVGDVNNDGYDDVLIGAPGSGNGIVALYLGGSGGLATTAAWSATGPSAGSGFGAALAGTGNVNGDSYSDFVVGAPGYSSNTGRIVVYHGQSSAGSISAALTVDGPSGATRFGAALSVAGHLNNDNYDEIAVGAPAYSSNTGRVHVYRGSSSGVSTTSPWTLTGSAAGERFGYALAGVGDADDNGYDDLLVGAPGHNSAAGKVALYPGTSGGLVTSILWSAVGGSSNLELGYAVAGAGDVNGDGVRDLLVGATNQAFVYHGMSGQELESGPHWEASGSTSEALGQAVAGVGDTNGDSFEDILVGAPGYNTFAGTFGAAYLFSGAQDSLPLAQDACAPAPANGPDPSQFGMGPMGGGGPGFASQAGRGIHSGTGNLVARQPDAHLPAVGGSDLSLVRNYNGLDAGVPLLGSATRRPFGPGWSAPMSMQLLPSGLSGRHQVRYGDGRIACFNSTGVSQTSGNFDTLNELDGGKGHELITRQFHHYLFDAGGRLTETIDHNGHRQVYAYDGQNRVQTITTIPTNTVAVSPRVFTMTYLTLISPLVSDIHGPEGFHLQYEYNAQGRITDFTDTLSNTWHYDYNDRGQVIEVITPEEHSSIQATYDAWGRTTAQIVGATEEYAITYPSKFEREVTDFNGYTTYYEYDDKGRIIALTDTQGYTETYGYDPDPTSGDDENQRTDYTDKLGRQWEYEYDDGRLVEAELMSGPLAGWKRTWSYGANGLVASATDPLDRTTEYGYDSHNNLTGVTNTLGYTRTITYNAQGQPMELRDFNGNLTQRGYDPATGDLLTLTNAVDAVIVYEYDDLGRVTEITDAKGITYTYEYKEESSLLTDVYGPLGYEEHYDYDDNGNRILAIDANGNETEFTYDTSENLTHVTDALTHTTIYTYTEMNLVKAMENARGQVTMYDYDDLYNRKVITDALGYTTTFGYDPVGNLTVITDANEVVTSYEYDDLNRQTKQIRNVGSGSDPNTDNVTTRYRYDLVGNTTVITDAKGVVTTLDYDPLNRMITQTLNYLAGGGDPTTVNLVTTYGYDKEGNMTRSTDALGRVVCNTYDEIYRLTETVQVCTQPPPIVPDPTANTTTRYGYDPNNNLLEVEDPLGRITAYEYDALNRRSRMTLNAEGSPGLPDSAVPTTYTYDAVGNLLTATDALSRTTRYEYDELNRVLTETLNYIALSVPTTDTNVIILYAYDEVGNLTDRTDPLDRVTHFAYDGLNRVMTETLNYVPLGGPTSDQNVTTTYTYDGVSNLITMTDARDVATLFGYDELNRVITQTLNYLPGGGDPTTVNVRTRFKYDALGNTLVITDTNAHTMTYSYDALNRLVVQSDAEGYDTDYTYDPLGNLSTVTDARDTVTRYDYDALNRVITETLNYTTTTPDHETNVTTAYRYDRLGNVLSVTDPNGHVYESVYDGLNRTTLITDALEYTTTYTYDALRLLEMADANGHPTDYTYDDLDRTVGVTNAENETTAYDYDPAGQVTTERAPDGVVTHYDYDGVARLSAVWLNYTPPYVLNQDNEKNVRYRFGYDRVGNLTSVTDPLTHTTTYEFDALSRLITETNPISAEWVYGYDGVGNVTERTDAEGQVTTYSYFPDNQLDTMSYLNGSSQVTGTVSYDYDPTNNPVAMVDSLGSTDWTYDPLHRLTSTTDALTHTLDYAYDAASNLVEMTYPEGSVVEYTYDANNWLATTSWIEDSTTYTTTYTRDPVGLMTQRDNGQPTSGNRATYTVADYDDANRLLSLEHRQDDSNDLLASFEYTVNNVGLRTQTIYGYGWRTPQTFTETYTYDNLRRLTDLATTEGYTETYGYDAASNRLVWEASDDRTTNPPTSAFTTTYSYDDANFLEQEVRVDSNSTLTLDYEYDANGNRTRLEENSPPDRGMTYSYDRENRLTLALAHQGDLLTGDLLPPHEGTLYCRDGDGRALVKLYDQNFGSGGTPDCDTYENHALEANNATLEYVLSGLDPVMEYTLQGNGLIAAPVKRDEFYRGAGNELLARQEFPSGSGGNQFFRYHQDGRGSIAAVTKEDGQSLHNYRYDAFGQLLPENGTFTDPHNHFTFSGKEWDENTELYDFGARQYDASAGVWLTADPYRGSISQPLSLHRSAYVHQSPISYGDDYGYWLTEHDEGGGGGPPLAGSGSSAGSSGSATPYETDTPPTSGGSHSSGSDASSNPLGWVADNLGLDTGWMSDLWHAEGAYGDSTNPFYRDVQKIRGRVDRAVALAEGLYGVAEAGAYSQPIMALLNPERFAQQWEATWNGLVQADNLYQRYRPEGLWQRAWTDPVGYHLEIEQGGQWLREQWGALTAAHAENPGRVEGAIEFEAAWLLFPWGKVGSAGRLAATPLDDAARLAATPLDDAARAAGTSRTVNPWRWCSFSADTPVATLEGSIPISELTAGAIVLGWDEALNVTGGYTVTDVWVHTDPEIVHLTLDGEAIETTPEHPFYVEGEGWVPAGALEVGDGIRRADGSVGVVSGVITERYSQPMYNLTVEEAHTFFVGEGQWLVHNQCIRYGGGTPSAAGTNASLTSRQLRDELRPLLRPWENAQVTIGAVPKGNNLLITAHKPVDPNLWSRIENYLRPRVQQLGHEWLDNPSAGGTRAAHPEQIFIGRGNRTIGISNTKGPCGITNYAGSCRELIDSLLPDIEVTYPERR